MLTSAAIKVLILVFVDDTRGAAIKAAEQGFEFVLILVFVDDTRGEKLLIASGDLLDSLNPCFRG